MRIRTAATLLATLTLLVGVALGVFIATPTIASALQPPSPVVGPSTGAARVQPSPVATSSLPAPTSAPSPAATYSGPLIAARGSREITRQQLHDWVAARPFFGDDPENDAIWEEQQWLDIRCMAKKGFLEDPTNDSLQDHEVSEADGLTAEQAKAHSVALWGPPTDEPYDWRTAGCHGRSVHLTGQDGNH